MDTFLAIVAGLHNLTGGVIWVLLGLGIAAWIWEFIYNVFSTSQRLAEFRRKNTIHRWFWAIVGVAFLSFAVSYGRDGRDADAIVSMILGVMCFLALLYHAIEGRINQLEWKLTEKENENWRRAHGEDR